MSPWAALMGHWHSKNTIRRFGGASVVIGYSCLEMSKEHSCKATSTVLRATSNDISRRNLLTLRNIHLLAARATTLRSSWTLKARTLRTPPHWLINANLEATMIQKSSVWEVRDCTGLHSPCNNDTKCVEDIDLGECRYITLKLIHCGKWNCNDHL